jgi:GT2 family glycosyltransferase/glycosyltransferase involved in cell wall biosynthesis
VSRAADATLPEQVAAGPGRGGAANPQRVTGLLSVVVVSHNGCELLRSCLESLRAEAEVLPVEVIVVDNASSDGAVAMVEAEHGWVRLIESGGNLGFARACNIGIGVARGEYVLLLNPDTEVPAGALKRCAEEIARRPEVGALGCKLVLRDGTIDHACKRSFPTPLSALAYMTRASRLPLLARAGGYTASHLGDDDEGNVDAINGAFMLVRAAAIDDVGLLDEAYWMYGEDLDWCHRLWSAGWTVLYWPGATVVHVKAGISGRHRSWKTNLAFHRAMWLFYRTHTAPNYPRVVTPAVWCAIWLKLGASAARSTTARSLAGLYAVRAAGHEPTERTRPRTRVLVVLPSLEAGGAERHAVTVYPAVDRTRFDVRLVCIKGRGPLYAEARTGGLPVAALDAGDGDLSIATSFFKLLRLMRAFRPDVVVTSGFSADLLGRLAARAGGVSAIVSWKHNSGHVGPYGRRERVMERGLRGLTTRYLAVANGQVPYLTGYLRLPRTKIEVIRNTVDPPAVSPAEQVREQLRRSVNIDADHRVVGVVAALREWKGHATLLRAFRLVVDQEPRARLLVIGDGEERDTLAELTDRLGVRDQVRFLGDRRDVGELLSIVDVVALASYSVECLPFAVLEAMSRGRPTVATDIGGLPELVEEGVTGLLVEPRDEQGMATALLSILQAADGGEAMGRAAYRRLVEDFPFDTTIRRVEEALESAVSTARNAR